MAILQTKILSSMEKCFTDTDFTTKEALTSITMLKNERLSFQLVYKTENGQRYPMSLELEGELAEYTQMMRLEQVPVSLTGACDGDYLSDKPGLYPDLLTPLEKGEMVAALPITSSVFFTIENTDGIAVGEYKFTVKLSAAGETVEETLVITVVDAMLPEQELIHTQWFHNDCIATYYGCDVFSERHWELIGNYMEAAVHCGVNMILTPVLTPPLDTAVGHERPTVQLVDIKVVDGGYEFGFEKLDRYVKLALSKGMKYFEISHLFSQWGAIHAPKVVAEVDGETKRIFGWDTDATSEEYKTFIRAFVTALIAELKSIGVDKNCYFHISDEPGSQHVESYTAAKNTVADLIADYHHIEALSSYEFYETGAVDTPIPCTDHIGPFLANNVPEQWTYYCCGQVKNVSNRLIAMPGHRTRILGEQLYKFKIVGFLQWGFNFWYSCGSLNQINPYVDTCGLNWVPAGDTFSVYPGRDGKAVYSLHALLFYEALQDLRALKLLENKLGRDAVVALLDFGCSEPMTFANYPRTPKYILSLRELVNRMV